MKRFFAPGFGRRVGIVIAVLSLIAQVGALALGGWGILNVSMVRDWLTVGKAVDNARIDEYVARAGLSSAGRFYLLAAHPTLHSPDTFDESCPNPEAGIAVLGCYSVSDDTIHLLDITDDTFTTLEPVVAAHETLHAVWTRLDPLERTAVSAEIEKSFAGVSNPDLLGRLAPYKSLTPDQRVAELFAILGTESATVTPALEEFYTRYFDNRQACVELALSAANTIAEISNSIESVGSQILAVEISVKNSRTTYTRDKRTLSEDIASFNAHAEIPGYFTSSSDFTRERDSLRSRQTALEKSRVALNEMIEQYNSLVEQMTVLNARAMRLNTALGIDASAMLLVPAEP
ncbi:MAG: hypothetical protein RL294_653 [Actinomycetota bacterium]